VSVPEGALFQRILESPAGESLIKEWMLDMVQGRLFSGYGIHDAGAATAAHVQLWNPSDRHTLFVRGFIAASNADAAVTWGISSTELNISPNLGVASGNLMGHPSVLRQSIARIKASAFVPPAPWSSSEHLSIGNMRVNNDSPLSLLGFPMLLILGPGRGLTCGLSQLDLIFRVTFFWKEVTAIPGMG
jgi:hypothetical protein